MKSFKLISFTTFFILLVITSSLAGDEDSTADKVEGTPILKLVIAKRSKRKSKNFTFSYV